MAYLIATWVGAGILSLILQNDEGWLVGDDREQRECGHVGFEGALGSYGTGAESGY